MRMTGYDRNPAGMGTESDLRYSCGSGKITLGFPAEMKIEDT